MATHTNLCATGFGFMNCPPIFGDFYGCAGKSQNWEIPWKWAKTWEQKNQELPNGTQYGIRKECVKYDYC